jgi:hypothetical protein
VAKQPVSYAWARANHAHVAFVPEQDLRDDAYAGLTYARELADDALLRREQNISDETRFPPLTIRDLAHRDGLSETTIRRQITAARRELFGALTDAGIYKREQRRRNQQTPRTASCKEPGCRNPLGRSAHGNRHFCPDHSTPAARVRRHRRGLNA